MGYGAVEGLWRHSELEFINKCGNWRIFCCLWQHFIFFPSKNGEKHAFLFKMVWTYATYVVISCNPSNRFSSNFIKVRLRDMCKATEKGSWWYEGKQGKKNKLKILASTSPPRSGSISEDLSVNPLTFASWLKIIIIWILRTEYMYMFFKSSSTHY